MTAPDSLNSIAVIGLGNMGSALAEALLSAGFAVVVWNRTVSKSEPLVAKGAISAGSAADAINQTQTIIVCLAEYGAIKSVVQNEPVAKALEGKLLVQLGGVTANQALQLEKWTKKHGIGYLEGSILGGPIEVRAAAANPVCSGPKSVFDANKDLLSAFGNPLHVSENIGAAYEFDKVNYPLGYAVLLGFLQGAALARASGFSLDAYAEITNERMPLYVERLKSFGTFLANQNYDVTVTNLAAWTTGCEMTLDLCRELGVDDTLAVAFTTVLQKAIDAGFQDKEILAVFEVLLQNDK